jgi:hypothetical protein
MIFDGLTAVYSTCMVCDQLMLVTTQGDHGHPCCNPDARPLIYEPPSLAGAAIQYAEWGFPVFPLAARSKKPAIPKTQGGHGFQDAHTDVERVGRWWSAHPRHNIGVATGHRFDVIDIDSDKGGNESLAKLLAAHRIPTCHGVVSTAGGGLHLYVEAAGRGNYAGVEPGVDYRGLGGYVAAPPSTRGETQSYVWLVAPSPTIKAGSLIRND